MVVQKILYIVTRNDVMATSGRLQIALMLPARRQHQLQRQEIFSIISENATASNFKIQHHVQHTDLIVSQLVGFSCRNK